MKIAIATPLFPPDTTESARYIKDLASRLSQKHEITIITYGKLPEQIDNVTFILIDKQQPISIRIVKYFLQLYKTSKNTDIIYAQNGASVELPLGFVMLLKNKSLIVHISDISAHKKTFKNPFLKIIEKFALLRAKKIITNTPVPRPEIIPFQPKPELDTYEKSWRRHINELENLFTRYVK